MCDGVQSGGTGATGIGEHRQAMIMKRPQQIQTYSSHVYFSANHLDHSRFRHTAVRFISQQTIFQHTHNRLTLAYKQCSMGHKENALLLNSNCFSEQQDGQHLCVASTVLFKLLAPNILEKADSITGQLRRVEEYPISVSGIINSSRLEESFRK